MAAEHIVRSNAEMDKRVKELATAVARQDANAVTVRQVAPWSLKERPTDPVRRRRTKRT